MTHKWEYVGYWILMVDLSYEKKKNHNLWKKARFYSRYIIQGWKYAFIGVQKTIRQVLVIHEGNEKVVLEKIDNKIEWSIGKRTRLAKTLVFMSKFKYVSILVNGWLTLFIRSSE